MVPISWDKVITALNPWNRLRAVLCSCRLLSLAVMLRWENVILKIALAILYWWYFAIWTICMFQPIIRDRGRTKPRNTWMDGYIWEAVNSGRQAAWPTMRWEDSGQTPRRGGMEDVHTSIQDIRRKYIILLHVRIVVYLTRNEYWMSLCLVTKFHSLRLLLHSELFWF